MMGAFVGPLATVSVAKRVLVDVPVLQLPGPGLVVPADLAARVKVPLVSGGAINAAFNESLRPLDRVFLDFAFFRVAEVPGSPAGTPLNALLPTATGLSNFGPLTSDTQLGPGSQRALTFLQQLAGSAFQPQYNSYLQAALRQGNLVLRQPAPDRSTAATLIANAAAANGNFLTSRNVTLLAGRSPQQVQAVVSGVLLQTGVASLPFNDLAVLNRPFDGSNGRALRVDPSNLYREVVGFEKTFLGGNASVGMRLPVSEYKSDTGAEPASVGDVSVVLKYALVNSPPGGNVLSTGLVVTAPTGPAVTPADGGSSLGATLVQPFVGGILRRDRFYLQGFSSVALPTDWRDAAVLFNDFGVGYDLYRGAWLLTGITPSVEVHVNTPLSHRGLDGPFLGVPDSVVLTGGAHFTFCRARLTVGASTPVTGPHPADFDAFAQLNFLF
jgi:hypothetical protein